MPENTSGAVSRLELRHGRPVIVFHGRPLSQAMYCDPKLCRPALKHSTPEAWLERQRLFVESGVHSFCIVPVSSPTGSDPGRFWTGDGQYPDCSPDDELYCFDRQMRDLVAMDPDVRVVVRFSDRFPTRWFEANPDHIARGDTGEGKHRRASMASDKALDGLCTFIERMIRYCTEQPWVDRVCAYAFYPLGEGTTMLNNSGIMFDRSPAMTDAFRRWAREHYADEKALRDAWGDPDAAFDTVTVPSDAEWVEARAGLAHWIAGRDLARPRDYWQLQRELWMRWFRAIIRRANAAMGDRRAPFGIDFGKVPMLGWQIRLSFRAQGAAGESIDTLRGSGHVDIGEILDEPGLDMLVTPADYTARTVGFGFEPEGLADSMRIRGKVMLCENDCRTFVPGEDHTQGAFRDVAEVRAGMLRNAAWSLSRGAMDYWMIAGSSYYDDAEVQEHGIRAVRPLLDAAPYWPHVETEHAIAMVIDDSSPQHENGTTVYQNAAVLWQRVLGLAHCGIPYRVYLWSDLAKDTMPDYRCWWFPNLFQVDPQRLDVLHRKVFRDGRMAIFGPATGITDGQTLSAEGATRVLGVDMELVAGEPARRVVVVGPHPIAQALPASTTYGDSQPFGPLLVPAKGAVERADGTPLGMGITFWQVNRPGLFVRDVCEPDGRTYWIAWSVAVPLPANLLRELARYGGCHVWCDDDDVVLASETVAAVHSVKAGPRVLDLPTERMVWDLINGECLGHMRAIPMEITPPETRVFYFGDVSPYATP